MTDPMISLFINAGPVGVLAYILWWTFRRKLDDDKAFHANLLDEMREDRQAIRAEMAADREAMREEFRAVRTEIHHIRDVLGGRPSDPPKEAP